MTEWLTLSHTMDASLPVCATRQLWTAGDRGKWTSSSPLLLQVGTWHIFRVQGKGRWSCQCSIFPALDYWAATLGRYKSGNPWLSRPTIPVPFCSICLLIWPWPRSFCIHWHTDLVWFSRNTYLEALLCLLWNRCVLAHKCQSKLLCVYCFPYYFESSVPLFF